MERTSRKQLSRSIVVALVVGLALGAAAGPASAVASSAWVKIKNWPSVMKVSVSNWPSLLKVEVMNPASSPIPTDHAARVPIHTSGNLNIASSQSASFGGSFYTVPTGKWLTVTGISSYGYGQSVLGSVKIVGTGSVVVEVPVTLNDDGGTYFLSGACPGERTYAPGTSLYLMLERASTPATPWTVTVYLDGYLTDKP